METLRVGWSTPTGEGSDMVNNMIFHAQILLKQSQRLPCSNCISWFEIIKYAHKIAQIWTTLKYKVVPLEGDNMLHYQYSC